MIKYRYAEIENGDVFCIDEVDSVSKGANTFYCIGCKNEMIAKLGSIRDKHFAHKRTCTSNKETYLHQTGKVLFRENYEHSLKNNIPFLLEYYEKQSCNLYKNYTDYVCPFGKVVKEFNLIEKFKQIEEEKRFNGFIPDLRIFDDKESIFIEIAVTHQSSSEKVNSNHRIIEFQINEEEDLDALRLKMINLSDPKIKFYNFREHTKYDAYCGEEDRKCKEPFYLYLVKKNGDKQIDSGRMEWLLANYYYDIEEASWYKFYLMKKFKDIEEPKMLYEMEKEYNETQ